MANSKTLTDTLKLICDSKSRVLLNELFLLQEINYQGLEYMQNGVDIFLSIYP